MFYFKKLNQELPVTRLVFEVSLEGTARKLITVRSALQLINKLNDVLEVRLENTLLDAGTT